MNRFAKFMKLVGSRVQSKDEKDQNDSKKNEKDKNNDKPNVDYAFKHNEETEGVELDEEWDEFDEFMDNFLEQQEVNSTLSAPIPDKDKGALREPPAGVIFV